MASSPKRDGTENNSIHKNRNCISFVELGDDVLVEITSNLDAISIVYFLSSSKQVGTLKQKSVVIVRISPYQPFIRTRYWNGGLMLATSKANLPQIQYFLSKGADGINNAMGIAAQKGNRYLVDYFIHSGACRWNFGMERAAVGGHSDLVRFFISKGARDWTMGSWQSTL